jgi:hypothetical protein
MLVRAPTVLPCTAHSCSTAAGALSSHSSTLLGGAMCCSQECRSAVTPASVTVAFVTSDDSPLAVTPSVAPLVLLLPLRCVLAAAASMLLLPFLVEPLSVVVLVLLVLGTSRHSTMQPSEPVVTAVASEIHLCAVYNRVHAQQCTNMIWCEHWQ